MRSRSPDNNGCSDNGPEKFVRRGCQRGDDRQHAKGGSGCAVAESLETGGQKLGRVASTRATVRIKHRMRRCLPFDQVSSHSVRHGTREYRCQTHRRQGYPD